MVEILENEKYIRKKGVYRKEGGKTQVSRDREETRRAMREKRVNSNIFNVNVVSLGQFVLRKWFIHLLRSAFSSLFFSSGRIPL